MKRKHRRDVRGWYGKAKEGAKRAYSQAKTGLGKAKHHAKSGYATAKHHAGRAHEKAKSAYASGKKRAGIAKKHYGAMREEMRTSSDHRDHRHGHRSSARRMMKMRDRKHAARIPKSERLETSRTIQAMVRKGYSPTYASKKAYEKYGRDPRLTAAERRRIPKDKFALPSRRQLPLTNKAHIRNAASRLEQMKKRGTVTTGEYKAAHSRIRKAERAHGIHPRKKSHKK
jgi:hypothetical protein